MGFSGYDGIAYLKRLRRFRSRQYKEKLGDLYRVEYDLSRPDKELRTIPIDQVRRTIEKQRSERKLNRLKRIRSNFSLLVLAVVVSWGIIELVNYLLRRFYA